MREAAVGNALSPTVDSRVGGTISADVISNDVLITGGNNKT